MSEPPISDSRPQPPEVSHASPATEEESHSADREDPSAATDDQQVVDGSSSDHPPAAAPPPPPADTEEKTLTDQSNSIADHQTNGSVLRSFPYSSSSSDEGEETIPVSVKRYTWTPPKDAARYPYQPHQGEGSQYLRDFILGVNDGLISTFLVVVGVVGGNSSTLQALLAGISSAIAGALSMGIGEYVATKSQLQVNEGERRLENEHFKYHRDVELEQLRQFLTSVNLSGNLLEAVVSEVGRSDEGLMKMMQAFEFGGEEELERNPLKAMWMSGRLFFLGSIPTVIPFFFSISTGTAVGIAAALVGVCLFIVGAYKTKTTRGNWLVDGTENLVMGAIGAGIAYAVGVLFHRAS